MERKAARGRSRALVPLLLGALALVVLSFLVSTVVVAEQRARGSEDAGERIATNAMPSIVHLAGARSDLRLLEGLLIEHVLRVAAGKDPSDLVPRIRATRAEMGDKWALEKDLPVYPGEPRYWVEIEAALADVDAATERILAARRPEQAQAQALIHDLLRPGVDRLAEALLADVQFNAAHAERDLETLAAARTRQRTVAFALEGASALFALIAGLVLAQVLRRYRAETEAQIAELDLYAARVAHDIRSPLGSVRLAIEQLRQGRAAGEHALEMLDRASRSVRRIAQMVDALLALAGTGPPAADGARTEVRALCADAIEESRPAAQANGVDLALDPFDPVEVACTPGVVGDVVGNLIGNAIKHIGDRPEKRVRVGARAVGPNVRIGVFDTGPGVPAEVRDRVFDPYMRAAPASTPGLGLGLATVRRMVEACGGKVGVDACPEGGSVFWVDLPKAPAAAPG